MPSTTARGSVPAASSRTQTFERGDRAEEVDLHRPIGTSARCPRTDDRIDARRRCARERPRPSRRDRRVARSAVMSASCRSTPMTRSPRDSSSAASPRRSRRAPVTTVVRCAGSATAVDLSCDYAAAATGTSNLAHELLRSIARYGRAESSRCSAQIRAGPPGLVDEGAAGLAHPIEPARSGSPRVRSVG